MKESPVFADFKKAVTRLKESMSKEKTIERRDSALMRFQLSFDTGIKSIKEYLKSQGKECYVAKQCLRSAFQIGLIEHDSSWLQMVDDRNEIIHSYNEEVAEYIYSKLNQYLVLFNKLIENLEKAEV